MRLTNSTFGVHFVSERPVVSLLKKTNYILINYQSHDDNKSMKYTAIIRWKIVIFYLFLLKTLIVCTRLKRLT